ncbi:unnamed protein product [Nippostrongylus brasiliensis]|uniref:Secreted protein n=1 Tax=Nippostrongylus brasiliensis TaxID=27835 RepID=A0A0N4Y4P9_NIPBR|nr:unnamed protein product [Nippostrongylus brasiliensis]
MNCFLLLLVVITCVDIARGQFWRPRPPPPPMNPLGTTVVENIEVMGPLGSGLSSRKIVGSNGGYSFQQQVRPVGSYGGPFGRPFGGPFGRYYRHVCTAETCRIS